MGAGALARAAGAEAENFTALKEEVQVNAAIVMLEEKRKVSLLLVSVGCFVSGGQALLHRREPHKVSRIHNPCYVDPHGVAIDHEITFAATK